MTAPVAGSVTSSALPSDAATHAPPRKAVSSKSDPSVRPAIPGGANVVVMIRSFSDYALSQIVGGLPLKFRVEIGANGAEPFKFRTMDGRRRSEEHTSETQSLMRISNDVLGLH